MSQFSNVKISEKVQKLNSRGDHTSLMHEIIKEIKESKNNERDSIVIQEIINQFNSIRSPWIFSIARSFIKKSLIIPIIQSLVKETDPSYQRYYVELLELIIKKEKLRNIIVQYIKKGGVSDIKINAVNVLYWVGINEEIIQLLLELYTSEKNTKLLRSIIGILNLVDLNKHPDSKEQIQSIFNKALDSKDGYIRNRAEIFFGQKVKLKSIKA